MFHVVSLQELSTGREATLWKQRLTRNNNELTSIMREIEIHSEFDHSTVAKFLRVEFLYEQINDPDPARREAHARGFPEAYQVRAECALEKKKKEREREREM